MTQTYSGLVYLDACALTWIVQPKGARDYPEERKATGRILQLGMRGELALRTTSWIEGEAGTARLLRLRKRCGVGSVSHIEEGTVLGAFILDHHRLGPYAPPPQREHPVLPTVEEGAPECPSGRSATSSPMPSCC